MTKVYAATSGDFSDYSVSCIFERREDAQAYIEAQTQAAARFLHESAQQWEADPPRNLHKGRGFEDCAECKARLKENYEWQVEEFDFYAAGEVPVNGS